MPIFDWFQEEIDELEEAAMDDPAREVLIRISAKKRDLLDLRRIIGPQREVIGQLTRGDVPFVREQSRVYLRDVQDHLIRAVETIEIYRDLVLGARDIYLTSLSNRTNSIMKTLTVFSVIALPMTVITSFFGMNFDQIPGLHSVWSFWAVVLMMLSIVAGLLLLFRRQGWF
jgi:magnesium transporter